MILEYHDGHEFGKSLSHNPETASIFTLISDALEGARGKLMQVALNCLIDKCIQFQFSFSFCYFFLLSSLVTYYVKIPFLLN